jgi:hypothetical protein
MSTPLTASIPHQPGYAEARRRIETGFAKTLRGLAGGSGQCSER